MKLKSAMKTNNAFIMSNPLLPTTQPMGSVISPWNVTSNAITQSGQHIFTFPSTELSDTNQVLSYLNQLQNSNFTYNSVPVSNVNLLDKTLTKMKTSQVNLDGNKYKSNVKFKPY